MVCNQIEWQKQDLFGTFLADNELVQSLANLLWCWKTSTKIRPTPGGPLSIVSTSSIAITGCSNNIETRHKGWAGWGMDGDPVSWWRRGWGCGERPVLRWLTAIRPQSLPKGGPKTLAIFLSIARFLVGIGIGVLASNPPNLNETSLKRRRLERSEVIGRLTVGAKVYSLETVPSSSSSTTTATILALVTCSGCIETGIRCIRIGIRRIGIGRNQVVWAIREKEIHLLRASRAISLCPNPPGAGAVLIVAAAAVIPLVSGLNSDEGFPPLHSVQAIHIAALLQLRLRSIPPPQTSTDHLP